MTLGLGSFNAVELFARQALGRNEQVVSRALERLATGHKLNRASDDPAGAMALERLSSDQAQAMAEIERIQRDDARAAATEGGLSVVGDLMIELESLAVEAANTGGLGEGDREALQVQADSIVQAVTMLADTTTFKGEQILSGYAAGSLGRTTTYDEITDDQGNVTYKKVELTVADFASGGRLNLLDGDLELAQTVAKAANKGVSTARAAIGNQMRSNASRIGSLVAQREGLASTISSIRDADFAAEASRLTRGQLLANTSIRAILASRDEPGRVLGLLGASGV